MAVTTMPGTCWEVVTAAGQPMAEDPWPDPHFASERDAWKAVAQEIKDGTLGARGLRPVRRAAPCVQLTCDECGEVCDEEGEGYRFHFEDAADVDKVLGVGPDDWSTDGVRHHCPCDDCPRLVAPESAGVQD